MMATNVQHLLITGSTSNIGAEFVKRFLETTDAHLWLMVRKLPEARDPKRRFDQSMQRRYPGLDLTRYHGRIHIFSGDLTKRNLGIIDSVFAELQRTGIREVFHFAASTDRKSFSKDTLFNVNFEGTLRLQRFCQKIGVKTFNHISWLYAGDRAQDDYLNFLENAQDFSNINEFIHRLTTATLIRRCREVNMTYRIVQAGSFMDLEDHFEISHRWYYYVCKAIFDLVAGYRKVGKSSVPEIVFPAAEVPMHVTTPRFAAHIFAALYEEGTSSLNQIYDVWNQRVSVKKLLRIVSKEFSHIQFRFEEDPRKLPLLERFLLKRSFIFFDYLLKHRLFLPDVRIDELRKKYEIKEPLFNEEELGSLAKECSRLYRLDPHHTGLPWALQAGLQLWRKIS